MLSSQMNVYYDKAILLLKQLIATPSISTQEDRTADLIGQYLTSEGYSINRKMNNIWVGSHISDALPTILLNSHHDTVKPSSSWTIDPFTPLEKDGKLYGLGSNDAGGSLVSLMMVFQILATHPHRTYNLIYSATAEEETTGMNGIKCILPELGNVDLAIVGEPTQMQMAVAEKGLMVLDCKTTGKAGHAARDEGVNAIYKAIEDIQWFQNFQFPKESVLSGKVKMSVTVIHAGMQHNVVPDECHFIVDVRTNEHYSNEQALEIIRNNVKHSIVIPRSLEHNSSGIPLDHPLVKRGRELGLSSYGSPTTSDQAVMHLISMKIGPGDSARSHTADEYILLDEIKNGIDIYLKLLQDLVI
jgi:acetylornithine deacetylase